MVHKKSVGGWTVNKCFICDTHTHATYDDTARVLVNCSLKVESCCDLVNIKNQNECNSASSTFCARLQAHPPDEKPDTSSNFSTLFKVVLPPHVDNRPVGTVGKYFSFLISQELSCFVLCAVSNVCPTQVFSRISTMLLKRHSSLFKTG